MGKFQPSHLSSVFGQFLKHFCQGSALATWQVCFETRNTHSSQLHKAWGGQGPLSQRVALIKTSNQRRPCILSSCLFTAHLDLTFTPWPRCAHQRKWFSQRCSERDIRKVNFCWLTFKTVNYCDILWIGLKSGRGRQTRKRWIWHERFIIKAPRAQTYSAA